MTSFHFDADELLKEELFLTKMDVATRQLNAAVQMFFSEFDPVALHTVVSAGHDILYDLASAKGIEKSVKDSPLIKKHARKGFIKALKYPQNFFKHADRDPNDRMAFRYNVTPILLFDAIILVNAMDVELSYEMQVFCMWVQLRFPDILCLETAEPGLRQIRETTNSPSMFKMYARKLLQERSSS